MNYYFLQCDNSKCKCRFGLDDETFLNVSFTCPGCQGTEFIELGRYECDVYPIDTGVDTDA